MSSLLDRFKNFIGPFVTPLFVVDDSPPNLSDETTVPGQIDRQTGGIKTFVINQQEQVDILSSVVENTDEIEPKLDTIAGKFPTLTSTDQSTTTNAFPVRQVPSFVPGKQLHVQTNAAIANAANKMLLGFSNTTGQTVYVTRVHAINMQSSPISGVFTYFYLKRGTTAITGGSVLTTASTPAILPSMRDPTITIPSEIEWRTAGTLGGTIDVLESARWTTDEVSPNGSGLAELILGAGNYQDLWDFSEDPVVVPHSYSLAVMCDSTTTNGQTLIDFNIRFAN